MAAATFKIEELAGSITGEPDWEVIGACAGVAHIKTFSPNDQDTESCNLHLADVVLDAMLGCCAQEIKGKNFKGDEALNV